MLMGLVAAVAAVQVKRLEPGSHPIELVSEGVFARKAWIRVPPAVTRGDPLPMVINHHGWGSKAFPINPTTGDGEPYGMDLALADREGFIGLYPQGLFDTATGDVDTAQSSHNAGACCYPAGSVTGFNWPNTSYFGNPQPGLVDDVAFLRLLVDRVATLVPLDRDRVYQTGMSNGGDMAYRIACEASDLIAAVAPVAGVMGHVVGGQPTVDSRQPRESWDQYYKCDGPLARPMPLFVVHGGLDFTTPLLGNSFRPGVAYSMNILRGLNGNAAPMVETHRHELTECSGAFDPATGNNISICVVVAGQCSGHLWPGAIRNGKPVCDTSQSIDASELIWAFFKGQKIDRATIARPPVVPEREVAEAYVQDEALIRGMVARSTAWQEANPERTDL